MIYQYLILAVLTLFFINFVLNLLSLKRPSRKAALPDNPPLVSVLVPARNEEDNIAGCLASILKQDYPNFEVLVLDDNSSDSTPEIVKCMAAGDARLRLLRGKPLREGWAGKCYACHQLSQNAGGDWLLFLDADTVIEPWTIRGALDIAIENNVSMLSGFPRQKVSGLSQKIVIPILFYFMVMSWIPLWLIQRLERTIPSLAIGQFLLFNSSEYRRIRGHEAVKSRIMEDVWFGIEMSRMGGRTLSVDLSRAVTTNAYTSLADMSEGCMKWFYSLAALSPLALVGLFMVAYIFFLAPFYWMVEGPPLYIASGILWTEWAVVLSLQISLLLLMRVISDLYFRGPLISFIFHPLGMIFLILTAFYAAARRIAGVGVAWKDRVYHAMTHVK